MADKKNNPELKKHVATIHSGSKLSLVQRKITNALLYHAYDDLLTKDEHEIHIATLCKLIGYDSNDHKAIKKALVDLLSTVIEWNIVDGDRLAQGDVGVWSASSLIADASIDGPICTYSYSNKMKKLLYHPELYGRLNMLVQAKFKSSYGLALYENCIRYQDIGQTPWLEMSKFRKLMGVEEGKYKVFRDFKSRVLNKALEEVNTYSAIQINVQLRKEGRQPTAIQFLITSSKQRLSSELIIAESQSLSHVLKNQFGLSKPQIADLLMRYEEPYILEKIQIVHASSTFQTGKINNLAKYLLSALAEDYQAVKSSKSPARQTPTTLEFNGDAKIINHIKKRYIAYRNQEIDLAMEHLPEEKKQILQQNFLEQHKDAIQVVTKLQRKKYSQENIFESSQIKALFRSFASTALSTKTLALKTIDEFVNELSEFEREVWRSSAILET